MDFLLAKQIVHTTVYEQKQHIEHNCIFFLLFFGRLRRVPHFDRVRSFAHSILLVEDANRTHCSERMPLGGGTPMDDAAIVRDRFASQPKREKRIVVHIRSGSTSFRVQAAAERRRTTTKQKNTTCVIRERERTAQK